MKTSILKHKNMLLLAITLCSSSLGIAQIKFDERNLSLLQTIAYGSTYENIVASFQNFNVPLDSRIENEDKSELLTFTMTAEKKISIMYSKDKEFIYACLALGPDNNENSSFIERELFLYKDFVSDESRSGQISGNQISTFNREDYPYEFILVHWFDYNNYKDPKFQKVYILNKKFTKIREAITKIE